MKLLVERADEVEEVLLVTRDGLAQNLGLAQGDELALEESLEERVPLESVPVRPKVRATAHSRGRGGFSRGRGG